MKHFNERWQILATRARQVPRATEAAPFGFATRVVTTGMAVKRELAFDAWNGLSWRFLAGTAAILLVCIVLEVPHLSGPRPLESGVENTVAQLVWNL